MKKRSELPLRVRRPPPVMLAFVLSLATLAGCALPTVTQRPAQTEYRLRSLSSRLAQPGLRPVILRVLPVQAAPGLGRVDMLYSAQPLQLMPYRDSRWLVPPAQMVDSALRQTLQRQPWVAAVEGMLPLRDVGATLVCSLQRLEQDVAAHSASLGLRCQLVDSRPGTLLAAWDFQGTQKLAQQDAAGYAMATQRLLDRALQQVLRRSAAALRRRQQTRGGCAQADDQPCSPTSRSSASP